MQSFDNIRHVVWGKSSNRRRNTLLLMIFIPSIMAAYVMFRVLPVHAGFILSLIISILFSILFAWISVGFWIAFAGLFLSLRRYDRFAVSMGCPNEPVLSGESRTAILVPVYNEDAKNVTEGIRTVFESLRAIGQEQYFDIFILSDTTNPEIWIQEEEAWYALCQEENAFGRIFYRRRKSNMKRKSGNVADFCRRWGADYRYMIVFDADSLMSGNTLVRMVQSMEIHPEVGILQTPPKAINSRSLIARVQQFANHLYGPIFASGVHFWQLGDAQYWGHNAIIRVEPFRQHCQLPRLPGNSPLGGEILSHDFVESALMRRAGYGVWLAYDFEGSFEQNPPTLIDELARDRRWCQGNLQHSRLIFTRGFFPTHRALFINGIMSYVSALLWFFFLIASSIQAFTELFVIPSYFPSGRSLFPDWPKYFTNWTLSLLGGTAVLLFLPKALAILLVIFKGGAKMFGGAIPMCVSAMCEMLISTFLAPVRMLFHSYFVVTTLLGVRVSWNAQNRNDNGTTWRDAIHFHWWGTLLGLIWGSLMYIINPGFFLWLAPIVIGLAISVPLSVWTSRVSLGEGTRRLGLFLTPPDIAAYRAPEIERFNINMERPERYSPIPIPTSAGFLRAVVVPSVFNLHTTLISHKRRNSEAKKARLTSLIDKALAQGPEALAPREKIAILSDPDCLRDIHRRVWDVNDDEAERWGIK